MYLINVKKFCLLVKNIDNLKIIYHYFRRKNYKSEADDKISKNAIKREFIAWFKEEYPEQKKPPSSEIVEFLDIKCGKYKKAGWWGWKIKYDDYPDEEYDME